MTCDGARAAELKLAIAEYVSCFAFREDTSYTQKSPGSTELSCDKSSRSPEGEKELGLAANPLTPPPMGIYVATRPSALIV